uniref:Uncharacterized protein LOC113798331 n=1 Tax=Dermatophagoides pteronyssinus TaxID=6956 RepID=A0A6P6YHE6_DERPT|nr:uncharacterized protein LOC113798331 [Dermatophagoides pteronyssinus]
MVRLLSFIDNHWPYLLMIGVIIILNDVWMANGDKSFIMRGIEDQTEWDMVRYPYKSVYGLPKSLQCSDTIQHQFNECEKSSHRKWKVTIDEYFYETKEFCCFVWDAMACEIEIAAKCNRNYSQQIETNTRQLFTSVCDKIRSSQRSWNCFWTEDMKIIAGVVVTVITVLLVVVGAYIGCRQYRANAKLKKQAEIDKKIKLATDNVQSPKKIDNVLQRSDVEMKDINQENVNEIRKGISTLKLDDKGTKRKETSPPPPTEKKRRTKTPPPSQPSRFRSKRKRKETSPPPPTEKKGRTKTPPPSQPSKFRSKQKRKEIPMEIDNGQSSSSVSSSRQKKQKIIPMEIDDQQPSLSSSYDNIHSKSKRLSQAAPPPAAAAAPEQQQPPPRPSSAPQLSTTSPSKITTKVDYSNFLKQFLSNIHSNKNLLIA